MIKTVQLSAIVNSILNLQSEYKRIKSSGIF
jgi:hypothetical protein